MEEKSSSFEIICGSVFDEKENVTKTTRFKYEIYKSVLANTTGNCSGLLTLQTRNIGSLDKDVFKGFPNITTINLNGNSLSYLYSGMFDGPTALTSISLNRNSITDIEVGAFNLPLIEIIHATHNSLPSLRTNLLANLPNLNNIDFSANSIKELADFMGNETKRTSPEKIVLKNNKISNVTAIDFGNKFTLLDLSENLIYNISTPFQAGGSNVTLDLNANKLNVLKSGIFENLNLISLDVRFNSISQIDSGALVASKATNLYDLSIYDFDGGNSLLCCLIPGLFDADSQGNYTKGELQCEDPFKTLVFITGENVMDNCIYCTDECNEKRGKCDYSVGKCDCDTGFIGPTCNLCTPPPNCLISAAEYDCDLYPNCTSCSSGFYPSTDGTCTGCLQPTNCTKVISECQNPDNNNNNTNATNNDNNNNTNISDNTTNYLICEECEKTFYLENGNCLECAPSRSCLKEDLDSTCVLDEDNITRLQCLDCEDGNSIGENGLCQCALGHFFNYSSATCQECLPAINCSIPFPHCIKSDSDQEMHFQCQVCDSGFYFKDEICVNCESSVKCIQEDVSQCAVDVNNETKYKCLTCDDTTVLLENGLCGFRPADQSGSNSSGVDTLAVALGVGIGVAVLLIIALAITVYYLNRRKRNNEKQPDLLNGLSASDFVMNGFEGSGNTDVVLLSDEQYFANNRVQRVARVNSQYNDHANEDINSTEYSIDGYLAPNLGGNGSDVVGLGITISESDDYMTTETSNNIEMSYYPSKSAKSSYSSDHYFGSSNTTDEPVINNDSKKGSIYETPTNTNEPHYDDVICDTNSFLIENDLSNNLATTSSNLNHTVKTPQTKHQTNSQSRPLPSTRKSFNPRTRTSIKGNFRFEQRGKSVHVSSTKKITSNHPLINSASTPPITRNHRINSTDDIEKTNKFRKKMGLEFSPSVVSRQSRVKSSPSSPNNNNNGLGEKYAFKSGIGTGTGSPQSARTSPLGTPLIEAKSKKSITSLLHFSNLRRARNENSDGVSMHSDVDSDHLIGIENV